MIVSDFTLFLQKSEVFLRDREGRHTVSEVRVGCWLRKDYWGCYGQLDATASLLSWI